MPFGYDFRESLLPPGEQERLNELRKIRLKRNFTPEELEAFRRLSEAEESQRELTSEERKEYTRLSKKLTDKGFADKEERARFVKLQRKLDESNRRKSERGY